MAAPDFDPQTPNGNPNRNDLCGRSISVTGPKGTVIVKVVDRCPVCNSVSENNPIHDKNNILVLSFLQGDLDLSPAAFNQIADPTDGRIPIDWHFL
jgi:expansin (peptidoglycan-binding protein)